MPPSPWEAPASIRSLRHLLAKGILTGEEEQKMEREVRRELPWRNWLDRGLLALGTALVLSGVVYFFAHNWDHLTNVDKLGLAGGAVAACFLAAAWRGFADSIGKILLFSASAMVGVFLAVFGQVYQTGADTYELFTLWAVLILPWVALGRFMPLWLFWVAVLNFAFGCYLPSCNFWMGDDEGLFRTVLIGLAAINGGALLAREAVDGRGIKWLDGGWASGLLLTATMVFASLAVISYLMPIWEDNLPEGDRWLARIAFAVLVVGLGWFYSRIRPSLASLAIVTLMTCCVLTCQAARILNLDNDNRAGSLLAQGFITLMIFGAGIFYLRSQRQSKRIHS